MVLMTAMHQRQVQKVQDSYDSTPGLLSLFLQEKLVPNIDCFHDTTGRLRFMLEFENKSMLMW